MQRALLIAMAILGCTQKDSDNNDTKKAVTPQKESCHDTLLKAKETGALTAKEYEQLSKLNYKYVTDKDNNPLVMPCDS